MTIIDMHLHLYSTPAVVREGGWSRMALDKNIMSLSHRLNKLSIDKGLAIILDTNFLRNNELVAYLKNKRNKFSNLSFCFMLDFRKPDFSRLLNLAKDLKAEAIKIHPYLQKIAPQDYVQAGEFAKQASELGMLLVVDCSYGTRSLYEHSGVKLCAYLSNLISTPIIMAHSGGALVLDALSLAMAANNLYLETSLSLDFWQGSSVEKDFAFAFKKLGSERCLYGSDAPFVGLKESLEVANDFFKKYNFAEKDIKNILFNTAAKILRR